MDKTLLASFVLTLACLSTPGRAQNTKVKVTVYYESLCPDSKAFINKQLYPALTDHNNTLADRVNLTLVPFGKSTFVHDQTFKEYNFTCHHGPDECSGNKIHACGLHIVDGPMAENGVSRPALDFVNCLMEKVDRSQTPNVFPIKDCALKSSGVNVAMVENCAKHIDAQKYLADYGVMTQRLQPALTSVPTITFDGADDSKLAQENFVGALCKHLKMKEGNVPMVCDAAGGSETIGAFGFLIVLIIACLTTRF